MPVTQTFFPLLGVTPLIGRFFTPDESRFNAPKTVVLSHEFWLGHFRGDRGVVGTSLLLDNQPVRKPLEHPSRPCVEPR